MNLNLPRLEPRKKGSNTREISTRHGRRRARVTAASRRIRSRRRVPRGEVEILRRRGAWKGSRDPSSCTSERGLDVPDGVGRVAWDGRERWKGCEWRCDSSSSRRTGRILRAERSLASSARREGRASVRSHPQRQVPSEHEVVSRRSHAT